MYSFVRICPQCSKHTKYSLDKGTIKMFCECGFTSTMDINRNSHHEYNNNPLFIDINESLKQSDELLNNDFKISKKMCLLTIISVKSTKLNQHMKKVIIEI